MPALNLYLFVLTYQRDVIRGRGHTIGYQQHKYRIGQQHCYTESYLLPSVWRQTEREHAQNVEPETRQQDVEYVVQNSSVNHEVYGDVRIHGIADWINHFVTYYFVPREPPLAIGYVAVNIHQRRSVYEVHL